MDFFDAMAIDDGVFEQHVHDAFAEYLGEESPQLVKAAIGCRARNMHRQDTEYFLAKYCTAEEALALSFILLDVRSSIVYEEGIMDLGNLARKKEKECAEQKGKLQDSQELVSRLR